MSLNDSNSSDSSSNSSSSSSSSGSSSTSGSSSSSCDDDSSSSASSAGGGDDSNCESCRSKKTNNHHSVSESSSDNDSSSGSSSESSSDDDDEQGDEDEEENGSVDEEQESEEGEEGDEEAEDDDDEDDDEDEDGSSSDSSRSSHSSNSSSNKFRYSNVVIEKNLKQRDCHYASNESLKHSDDNLFTSLSKAPLSTLPKISFGISDRGNSVRGLPNRHATVPAPDTRPIPSRKNSFNAKDTPYDSSSSAVSSSSNKQRFKTRVKREDIVDIPLTDMDRDILMAIGKIKRQKQRPSVDRLYNILGRLRKSELDTKEKIESVLENMVKRSLLARVLNPDKGFISYRELNSAIPIVAINNPLKSRIHLVDKNVAKSGPPIRFRPSKSSSSTSVASKATSTTTPVKSSSPASTPVKKTVSTATMTNSIDESIERVVRRFCKESDKNINRTTDPLRCGMCGKSDKNELITCSVCGMSGHSTCLGCSETLLKRIKEFPNWECPNCKKCPVCGQHDDETNIICLVCDRAFHRTCLRMHSNSVFLSKYTCDDCDRLSRKQHSTAAAKSSTSNQKTDSIVTSPIPTNNRTLRNSPVVKKDSTKHSITPVTKPATPTNTNKLKTVQPRFTTLRRDPLPRISESSDSWFDCKKEEFCKKYLGRRGRRKGSFHLKRDLVSYRLLAQQRNLTLNYQLESEVKPQGDQNLFEDANCDYEDNDDENDQAKDADVHSATEDKLENSITEDPKVFADVIEEVEVNMKKVTKQSLITEFLLKKERSNNEDQSQDEEPKKDRHRTKTPSPKKTPHKKRGRTPKQKNNKTKNNSKQDITVDTSFNSPVSSSTPHRRRGRKSKKEIADEQILIDEQNKFKSKNYRALSPPLALDAKLEITDEDNELFKKVQQVAENRLSSIILTPLKTQSPTLKIDGEQTQLRCPAAIEIGNYEIETWYSSLYPHEYARLQKLFICEFCLKYMKSSDMLRRHMKKCFVKKPPGDEIYRSKQVIPNFHIKNPIYLSVYEVDGANAKWYCQNLCLLGKLFIDHKTLLFDVEHFLFYILTIDDFYGSHFVGYFSKEKFSSKRYNVSCIVTLPQFQRCGFGRFLIDFSYLLSKRELITGTPEKPLSDLGKLSYLSYWRFKIYQFVDKKFRECNTNETMLSVEDISRTTGLNVNDISSTLQWCNAFKRVNNEWVLQFRQEEIDRCLSKPRIELIDENLIWTPLVSNELQIFEDDEVYNVLFYDETLDQNAMNQIKGVQIPGKLKKKRRRRWNKAYNHTNCKKRKRPSKNNSPEKYDDDDDVDDEEENSQMASIYEDNDDDDTEEEEGEEEEIHSDENSILPEDTEFQNGGPKKLSNPAHTDESSCDNTKHSISQTEKRNSEAVAGSESGPNQTRSPEKDEDQMISPFKIKRKRSTSRSPFKRFKPNDLVVNGIGQKLNGKLKHCRLMMEENSSDSINSHQENVDTGTESNCRNNFDSPQRHRNAITNGVLKVNDG